MSNKGVKFEKGRRIDLGLAVSGALLKPGETRSLEEIAAYCDCHKNAIFQIEAKALKKLRHPQRLRQLEAELEKY